MKDPISVSRETFSKALELWASDNPEQAAFVTLEIPQTASYYLAIEGNAGFGVTQDGELIALFNHSCESGTGKKLVRYALEHTKAEHLWCFNTKLAEFYKNLGFEVVETHNWDEKQAPEHWNYAKYGRPNLLKMNHVL